MLIYVFKMHGLIHFEQFVGNTAPQLLVNKRFYKETGVFTGHVAIYAAVLIEIVVPTCF
jgi:hypothetical protein